MTDIVLGILLVLCQLGMAMVAFLYSAHPVHKNDSRYNSKLRQWKLWFALPTVGALGLGLSLAVRSKTASDRVMGEMTGGSSYAFVYLVQPADEGDCIRYFLMLQDQGPYSMHGIHVQIIKKNWSNEKVYARDFAIGDAGAGQAVFLPTDASIVFSKKRNDFCQLRITALNGTTAELIFGRPDGSSYPINYKVFDQRNRIVTHLPMDPLNAVPLISK